MKTTRPPKKSSNGKPPKLRWNVYMLAGNVSRFVCTVEDADNPSKKLARLEKKVRAEFGGEWSVYCVLASEDRRNRPN